MRSFMREKKIYCGKHYREVDIYPYTAAQLTASTRGKRSKKIKETEPKQKNLNDKNARRYFTQTANLNFGSDPEALHVTATYSGKYLPDTVAQAEQEATNFLRRVQYRRKKEGLPPLKYMIVTAYTTKRNSETPVRIHHHIIMNGGLDRDVVEDLWRKRRRKGQKKGDKIGFCNADRLQADENGIAALCTYLVKQGCGKKRWNSSHNLERPYSRTNDGKYNRRQIEKWAKEHPPREFWEKKYPGWTLTDDDYGVQYEYNDFTGWAVYLKLRKKEQRKVVFNMARPFKICPDCGAHLDASEPCDCKDEIEREPPKPRERLKLLAVCREVDKESGRVSVYPLDLEITSEVITSMKMRAQFNPELRYFTTTTARWDRYGEVMAGILKRRTVSRADLDNIGGICEI